MIYTIDCDLSHRSTPARQGEKRYDAEMIYFDDWENVRLKNPAIDYTDRVPPVIEFVGDLKILELSDFPYVSPNRLVMSRKMLEVLLSIQPFKHWIYPTLIYSYEIEDLVRHSFDGTRTDYQVEDSSLFTDKFIIMQLAEALDVLDEDKTIIRGRTAREANKWYLPPSDIQNYAFTKEEKDLPPVFTTPKTEYFFTEAAVRTLEAKNIRGVEFHPIPQKSLTTS
jgi:hypothetical protein